jgi:hypothetical protein
MPGRFAPAFSFAEGDTVTEHFDIVVVGGTPGGLCAAIAAARLGSKALVLERTGHIGGLCGSGLGATDIATRGATRGLFGEFVGRVHAHYVAKYGPDSPQVRDCSEGYHFEPHVAEQVFLDLVQAEPGVTIRLNRTFDASSDSVIREGTHLTGLRVTNRQTGAMETYTAAVFVDGTYEGDLAAAAGCAFETRREGKSEYGEPFAGRVYRPWGIAPLGEGSTETGDDTVQAYNYRLCLTDAPANRFPVEKPATYRREDYASLAGDIERGQLVHFMPPHFSGRTGADVGVLNPVRVPNGKTDTNNHHRAFVSTDLPEENWPYPRADWAWRDQFAARLRDYTLGLLYFCQSDPALPAAFRAEAAVWGLARDEYRDNGHFPRQIYVREGRRVTGDYLFTARDAIAADDVADAYAIMEGRKRAHPNSRPPVHADSVTSSHYAIDSHAVRKREPNRVHLDGFLGLAPITKPYQVPYGVIVPRRINGLLTPVPCSASHLGFGTLRMEPCWMALGQAAGVAAHLAISGGVAVRAVPIGALQRVLLAQGASLIYFEDVAPTHPHWTALQIAGCHGCFPSLKARPDEAVSAADAALWVTQSGRPDAPPIGAGMTRAKYAEALFAPPVERADVYYSHRR